MPRLLSVKGKAGWLESMLVTNLSDDPSGRRVGKKGSLQNRCHQKNRRVDYDEENIVKVKFWASLKVFRGSILTATVCLPKEEKTTRLQRALCRHGTESDLGNLISRLGQAGSVMKDGFLKGRQKIQIREQKEG